MKKVNFNVPFLSLDGTPVVQDGKQIMIKSLVANKIGNVQHEGSSFEETLRRFELARSIINAESPIEIDEKDVVFIRENLQGFTVAAAGQILSVLK